MRFIALALSVLLSACAVLRGPESLPELPLLSPASLGMQVQLSQRVTVDLDGEQQTFLAAWAVDKEQLSFVGLTPSGQRLLILNYGPEGFSEEYSPMLDEALPGRQVLSHLQMAHWPLAAIEAALEGSDWRMVALGATRQLQFKARPVLSIALDSESADVNTLPMRIRINSHLMPMKLEVETLQVTVQ